MSGIQPTIGIGPVGTPDGLAQSVTDLRRRVTYLEANRTIILNNALTGSQIQNGTITGSNIAATTITASLIAAGTITASQIAAGTITAAQIAAGTITAGLIAAGTITGNLIAAATITATNIAASTITSNEIAANTITASDIFAGTITSAQIAAGTIIASNIASHTITATQIAASTITATELSVSTLSAITSNLGSITAGTITGGTLQTAPTGSRVVMDSAGLRGYALDGVTKVFEINAGSGVATFSGTATLSGSSVVPGGTLTAGSVASAAIAPGAIVPSKIGFNFGGGNLLSDSSFAKTGLPNWTPINGTIALNTSVYRPGFSTSSVSLTSTSTAAPDVRNIAGSFVQVQPNLTYTASAYFISAAVSRNAQVWLDWLDAAGTRISSSISAPVATSTTGWTRVTVTAAAPSTAIFVRIICQILAPAGAGEVHYVDDAQVEISDVASSYSPKPDEILPGTVGTNEIAALAVTAAKIAANTITASQIAAATITAAQIASSTITATQMAAGSITANKLAVTVGGGNMAVNSSYEDGVTNWLISTGTGSVTANSTAPLQFGTQHLRATFTGTFSPGKFRNSVDRYPVTVGATYTYSFWARSNTTSIAQPFVGSWTAATGGTSTETSGTSQALSSTWQRFVYTFIPTDIYVALGVRLPTVNASEYVEVDGVQLEQGDVATSWTPKVDEILPGTIVANMLAANTITAGQIAAATITSTQIATGAITTNLLAAGAVTAQKLTVNWGGSNMLLNSGFEYNLYSSAMQNWNPATSTTITADNTSAFEGTYSAKVAATAVIAPRIVSVSYPVIETETYTGSAWVQGSGATIGRTIVAQLQYFTSGTVFINSTNGTPITLTGGWQRIQVTSALPATTALVRLNITTSIAVPSIGDFFRVDAAQLQPGEIATPYARRVDDIAPGEVGATEIGPNSITTNQILVGGIHADRIVSASITGTQIAASTITAANINVTTLSAITANMGTVTAGTITGATVQSNSTPTSGGVITDAAGLRGYGPKLTSGIPTTSKLSNVITTQFTNGQSVVYRLAVSSSLGMASAGTATTAIAITSSPVNQGVFITIPLANNATAYRLYRSVNGGTTYTAYLDVSEDWIIKYVTLYDSGNVLNTGFVGGSTLTWITAGSPFTPPATNNAIFKFLEASTSGGSISGAIVRSSDSNSRVQIDQTDGLTVKDSAGFPIYQLDRFTGNTLIDIAAGQGPATFTWFDSNSGGAERFSITPATSAPTLGVIRATGTTGTGIIIDTDSTSGLAASSIRLDNSSTTSSFNSITVKATNNSGSGPQLVLINADGASDFLRNNPAGGSQAALGVLRGNYGSTGLGMGCRSGNAFSVDWVAGVLQFWIDGTLVRTL